MEKSLVKTISNITEDIGAKFSCIDETKLAEISKNMIAINKATKSFGKKNSQTSAKLMTLNMLACSPYRALRQCLSQIESKRKAIKENMFDLRQKRLIINDLEGSKNKFKILEREKLSSEINDSILYIEGALKELAGYQDAYEQIRKNNNIRENWDEKDFEDSEIKHHVMSAFRNGVRDLLAYGNMGHGTSEYFEQFGINPMEAIIQIKKYVDGCTQSSNGNLSYKAYIGFLNDMANKYKENYKEAMKRLGLTSLLTENFLYRNVK